MSPSVSRAAHCPASGHEVEAARTPARRSVTYN